MNEITANNSPMSYADILFLANKQKTDIFHPNEIEKRDFMGQAETAEPQRNIFGSYLFRN